jgi:uncharacterized protein (DUF488 family)
MTIYTIGHSNLAAEELVALLRRHAIVVVVDVRTHPHSAHNPQFNQPALRRTLEAAGIGYRFAGRELGGRPDDAALRSPEGMPDYDLIAASRPYQDGIATLVELARGPRVAILCSEADPAACHREKLIGRTLREQGVAVVHIDRDGDMGPGAQPSLW